MDILKAIKKEIRSSLNTAVGQLKPSHSIPSADISYTPNFSEKAKAYGLTKQHAEDVYHHGTQSKQNPNEMTRAYTSAGYEIGIRYFLDKRTGKPVITAIWKNNLK